MACYIVTFEVSDIHRLGVLADALKSYNSYCPINATTWAIKSEKTAAEVRNHLVSYLDLARDRLFVVRSGTEAAWQNSYSELNNQWLKDNL